MTTVTETVEILAPAERVFGYVDDMRNVGWTSRLTISIDYQLPRSSFWRVLGAVLAGPYSRWCLRQMVGDAKRALELRVPERSLEHRS